MEYHYAYKYLVGYSDVDRNNEMKLSRIMDMFQNIATWHSKTIGYGAKEMKDLNMGWLVLNWKIKILSYPAADEFIEIRTWCKSPKGLHTYRDFEILDENGNVLILAESSWVLYDLLNKKIMRLPEAMMSKYGSINRDALEGGITKIREEKIVGSTLEIVPMKRDIDTNNHINNVKYVEFFEEILPDNTKINEIEVQYRRQAMLENTLTLTLNNDTCVIENEKGEVTTIIKFK